MPYGVKPTLKDKLARLWWDITHLFSKAINPFVAKGEGDLQPKQRTASQDILHAVKNIVAPNNKDEGSKAK